VSRTHHEQGSIVAGQFSQCRESGGLSGDCSRSRAIRMRVLSSQRCRFSSASNSASLWLRATVAKHRVQMES